MSTDTIARLNAALADRYNVERQLGEGGMATVYLAEDVRHDRKVAIKVLKPELAAIVGADRFLAEIKTTANLQHPHILPLHDSGEADGFLFYVMPFVEGESLRDKLDRERQLSVDEALHIARAVASALHYAHERDVIHRDIKPENILLHAGEPVVADFGIALALSEAGGGRMTETGLSMGTPHYMSPEQASADRDLSARSDVYSLACVLYEMLAGDPPHTGPTAQAILMRILTEDARAITTIRRSVPTNVAAVIDKGLEKLPADRFETAEQFKTALDDESFTHRRQTTGAADAAGAAAAPGTPAATGAVTWGMLLRDWRFGAVSVVALAALAAIVFRSPPEVDPPVTTRVLTSTAVGTAAIGTFSGARLGISRDGRWIAWTSGEGSNTNQLFIKRSDEPVGRLVPSAENVNSGPVFSPDGAWMAFHSGNELQRVPVAGGPTLTITSGDFVPNDWGPDGTLLGHDNMGRIVKVPGLGGAIEAVVEPESGAASARWPSFLPGQRAIVYTSFFDLENAELRVLDLETGEDRLLVREGWHGRFLPTGHIVYGHVEQVIMAAPFDLGRLEFTGPSVAVLDPVIVTTVGAAQFAVAENGTAIYQGSNSGNQHEFVIVDAAGNEEVLPLPSGPISQPRFSPDGRFVAYIDGPVLGDVFVYSIEIGTTRQLTFEGVNQYPAWTLDGTHVTFASARQGALSRDPYHIAADGSGAIEQLFSEVGSQHPQVWTPGGQLLYRHITPETAYDLYIATFGDGEPQLTPYLEGRWDEFAPSVSPDGNWVAYVSNQEGLDEIYVRAFPVPAGATKVSLAGGSEPVWSPDGETLYYRTPTGDFMAAQVRTDPAFDVLGQEIFRVGTGHYRFRNFAQYDFDRANDRFIVVRTNDDTDVAFTLELAIVTNWFEELKARMGGG